ncbi:methyltransferase family protein [Rhodopirellula sp. MGV]|uniref:methyltransferase family protein n=1 Tax=Rhodopirellula sp. MGV TaxID=2023130 RepID=UPI000B96088F|nr:isoprenylcysteine carboxylmethyltransferase family protein [Rhodopirellula sp. MGV]OYP34594.1 hypothetical protein CGZ80_14505 [Rhodopirellula sp. MGV]PNY37322.1 isoprenylcysteine carboxylmethyltransferase family protein [Rhodopirellula baltica]
MNRPLQQSFAVAAQFLLSAALVLSIRWKPFPVLAFLLGAPGMGLAVWAWFTIGLRNIRIHPSVTERTELVTSGAYRVVRHPMYSGLLWFTAATLASPLAISRCLMWGVLVIVLVQKSKFEEQQMQQQFPGYKDYRKQVGGLVPLSPFASRK